MQLYPAMRMNQGAMRAGVGDPQMVDMMLSRWRERMASTPDLEPLVMAADPRLPPRSCSGAMANVPRVGAAL